MTEYACGSCSQPESRCECIVLAQHEETGAIWQGPWRLLPVRYVVIGGDDDPPELTLEDLNRKDAVYRIGGRIVTREEWAEAARAVLNANDGR